MFLGWFYVSLGVCVWFLCVYVAFEMLLFVCFLCVFVEWGAVCVTGLLRVFVFGVVFRVLGALVCCGFVVFSVCFCVGDLLGFRFLWFSYYFWFLLLLFRCMGVGFAGFWCFFFAAVCFSVCGGWYVFYFLCSVFS